MPNEKYIASIVGPNGGILELVYKEKDQITEFAICFEESGPIKYCKEIDGYGDNETFIPYSAANPLVSKKVIKFPSEASEYGSDEELIKEIRQFIHKYLDISPFFEQIATYYVLFTWVYDQFKELPYLRVIGDYGSGKSRFLQVVGSACYKPMFVGGATTTSPIFRIIDSFSGTLILDEADYKYSDTTSEIIKILNSGYQKGSPVLRSEGKGKFEVKSYDVFCPKIIATRKKFDDSALESRFLIEEMDKKELRNDIPINLPDNFDDEALNLRNKLLMWRFRNLKKANLKLEDIDRTLEPRLNQIIMPLLSVINNDVIKTDLKNFIKEYNNQLIIDRGMSLDSEIFESLLKCLNAGYTEPTVKQITDTHNASLGEKEKLKSRRIGGILRNQLKLIPRRTSGGYVISFSENNEKITRLKKKFGIIDEQKPGEQMNDVNDMNDIEIIESGQSLGENPDKLGNNGN